MSFNSIEFDCGFYVTEALADTLYSRARLNPEPPAGCHMELELVDMGSNTCSIKCKGV